MKRREFLKATFGGALAADAAGRAFAQKPKSKHPNLVIVFPDQMRGQALGFMNEDPVITPHLDAFAKQSLVLTHAVSNYPVCSPFRAMLLTGRYPHANKVVSNCNSNTTPHDCQLQESDRTWSDVLHDKGYSLGYIGKWHLDSPLKPYVKCKNNSGNFAWNEWCPPSRRHGFDFWYAYGTYDYHLNPMYWPTGATRHEAVWVNQWGPEHEADLAIRYIRNRDGKMRNSGKPFALVVSMNPPHTPYSQVPQKYVDHYAGKTPEDLINRDNVNLKENSKGAKLARAQIKNYFAMVTGVDEQFGRILGALDDEGLAGDTIVLFTSDHGNCLGCHDVPTKNVHYEESMRVPFLVRWPGKIKPRRDDLLASTLDIYPTLLDLMGFRDDIPKQVDGVSRARLFRTGQGERPDAQFYIWVPYANPSGGRRGLRTHRYTLEIDKETTPHKRILHDNVNDPFQLKNIADEQPDMVKKLTEEMERMLKKYKDPWLES